MAALIKADETDLSVVVHPEGGQAAVMNIHSEPRTAGGLELLTDHRSDEVSVDHHQLVAEEQHVVHEFSSAFLGSTPPTLHRKIGGARRKDGMNLLDK